MTSYHSSRFLTPCLIILRFFIGKTTHGVLQLYGLHFPLIGCHLWTSLNLVFSSIGMMSRLKKIVQLLLLDNQVVVFLSFSTHRNADATSDMQRKYVK